MDPRSSAGNGFGGFGPGDLLLAPAPHRLVPVLGSTTEPESFAASEIRMVHPPVSSACLACRGKHLKCDGQRPCSRCITNNYECVYVASRRGYRGSGQAKTPENPHPAFAGAHATGPHPLVAPVPFNFAAPVFDIGPMPPFAPSTNFSNVPFQGPFGAPIDAFNLGFTPCVPRPLKCKERYLDAFYHHFHAAHPFVLPKAFLLLLARDGALDPLLAVIRWVGSLYVDKGPASDVLLKEAYNLVYYPGGAKDGFLVQAMLLLVIGLDGYRRRKRVDSLLVELRKIAVQLGLQTRLYALVNGQGIPVLEESWRRTWWELYVIDAMIAGVHRTSKFHLYEVPVDVALPCEEHQYLSGHIPPPLHLEDMDRNMLADGREFSSFAYRVQCCRIMGNLLTVSTYTPPDKTVAHIESLLTSWMLCLPPSKQNAYDNEGQLDEMMFQAHMMMHAISILLHQPHSQLDPTPTYYINACAPNTPALSSDALNAHTKRTMQSANQLSKLVTHRVPLLSHTHFFAYMLTLSSTIHLSKWSLVFVAQNDDTVRQNIRLNIGALVKYAEVWPAAQHLTKQVRSIAQEVYQMKTGQLLLAKATGLVGQ